MLFLFNTEAEYVGILASLALAEVGRPLNLHVDFELLRAGQKQCRVSRGGGPLGTVQVQPAEPRPAQCQHEASSWWRSGDTCSFSSKFTSIKTLKF